MSAAPYWANPFPSRMAWTRELIEAAHPAVVQRKWRTVTIQGIHVIATYRIVRRWPDDKHVYVLRQTSTCLREPISLRERFGLVGEKPLLGADKE